MVLSCIYWWVNTAYHFVFFEVFKSLAVPNVSICWHYWPSFLTNLVIILLLRFELSTKWRTLLSKMCFCTTRPDVGSWQKLPKIVTFNLKKEYDNKWKGHIKMASLFPRYPNPSVAHFWVLTLSGDWSDCGGWCPLCQGHRLVLNSPRTLAAFWASCDHLLCQIKKL